MRDEREKFGKRRLYTEIRNSLGAALHVAPIYFTIMSRYLDPPPRPVDVRKWATTRHDHTLTHTHIPCLATAAHTGHQHSHYVRSVTRSSRKCYFSFPRRPQVSRHR